MWLARMIRRPGGTRLRTYTPFSSVVTAIRSVLRPTTSTTANAMGMPLEALRTCPHTVAVGVWAWKAADSAKTRADNIGRR
jgi:hypothetical protein